MKTAVLAVLVAADMGLSAEEVALNFNADEDAVQKRLTELENQGHVQYEDGVFYAADNARPDILLRSTAEAQD